MNLNWAIIAYSGALLLSSISAVTGKIDYLAMALILVIIVLMVNIGNDEDAS